MKRLFGILIIAVVLPVTTGNAQHDGQRAGVTVPVPATTSRAPVVQGIATTPALPDNLYFGQNEDRKEWNEALKAFREADSESAKTDAKNKIEELLTAQYDESLDNYDRYLEELSSRLAEMKKQVEKRRDARDEMVQLKLLMVISEEEGLGWPDNRPGFGMPSLRIQSGPGLPGFSGGGATIFSQPSPDPALAPTPFAPADAPPKPDRPGGVR